MWRVPLRPLDLSELQSLVQCEYPALCSSSIRIVVDPPVVARTVLKSGGLKFDVDCASGARVGPNAPVERLDDAFGHGQTEARSALSAFTRLVVAAEGLKRFFSEVGREARSLIEHRDAPGITVYLDRDPVSYTHLTLPTKA